LVFNPSEIESQPLYLIEAHYDVDYGSYLASGQGVVATEYHHLPCVRNVLNRVGGGQIGQLLVAFDKHLINEVVLPDDSGDGLHEKLRPLLAHEEAIQEIILYSCHVLGHYKLLKVGFNDIQ